jgi:hypothetical protein
VPLVRSTDADPDRNREVASIMAGSSVSRALHPFKLADTLMVVAACAFAVLLASQPASPTPVAAHLTEAEFIAAKCYALRTMIGARTDPTAVFAWTRKEHVDAQACPELLARRGGVR